MSWALVTLPPSRHNPVIEHAEGGMPRAGTGRRGGVGTLLVLIIIFSALFIFILVGGWERLLAEFIPSPVLRAIVALVIAIVVIFAARVLGEEHARRADPDDEDTAFSLSLMIFLYAVIFVLSATGATNSLIYRFEGGTILQDAADQAQQDIALLQRTARARLLDARQEERRAAVERGLASLEQEINHPAGRDRCGVGPDATAIINGIARVLPGFRRLSGRGTGANCDRGQAQSLVVSYREQARQLLANDTEYVRGSGPQKAAFLADLDIDTRAELAALREATRALARGSDGFETVKNALERANDFYVDRRSTLIGLEPSVEDRLRQRLHVDSARGLGLFSHVLPILSERRDRFSTYFFPIVAIVFDLLLILLFRQYARATRGTAGPRRRSGRADPQFLWINPA